MELDVKVQQSFLKKSMVFEASLGFFALLFGYFTNVNPLLKINVNALHIFYGFVFCIPIVPLYFIVTYIPWKPFYEINKKLDETLLPLFKNFSWADIALVSMLAGVCEELMFRGWIEGFAFQYFGLVGSAILTNILFGLAHFITPMYAIFAFLMGCILSFAAWYTNNLLVAIIMHAVYDFFALGWYLKYKSPAKA